MALFGLSSDSRPRSPAVDGRGTHTADSSVGEEVRRGGRSSFDDSVEREGGVAAVGMECEERRATGVRVVVVLRERGRDESLAEVEEPVKLKVDAARTEGRAETVSYTARDDSGGEERQRAGESGGLCVEAPREGGSTALTVVESSEALALLVERQRKRG